MTHTSLLESDQGSLPSSFLSRFLFIRFLLFQDFISPT
uniref:Uncharacterized protein n=1 Tax=Lepeophtheirus salmonis TaxID=72036 RepID=A0A0K2VE06_LEPSM